MTTCKTCELLARRDEGAAPPWDNIYRAPHWDVVHCYNTSLPGWLVLVCRRHVEAVHELNDDQAIELGRLIRQASLALHEVTGCVKTYVVQFAEAEGHSHVHVHVIPRMADQPADRRGPQVFGYLSVPDRERVSEETMNDFALRLRRFFP